MGGLGVCGGVLSVCVVILDSLCRRQVQVSVYCARRISAHLRCILDASRVQLCCTLSISASYRVFVCCKYRKSKLACVWLSDLDL